MVADQFFTLTPDSEVACGDTGYFLKMEFGRDGNTLFLRHETHEISQGYDPKCTILCFCSRSGRPMTILERIFQGRGMCPNVVLWAVSWGKHMNTQEIDGLGNTRKFLDRFFRWYQLVSGIGCYVDDKPNRALVEVRFGTAWYGIDH